MNAERNRGVKKFTKPFLERKPPATGREVFRDKDSPLSIRISSTGRRRYIVRKGGRRFTFKKAATFENLAEARRWAITIDAAVETENDVNKALVAENFEPVSNGRARGDGKLPQDDFERVMNWYLSRFIYDTESRTPKPKRTARQIEAALRNFVLPRFRGKRMAEITRTDIHDLLDDVAAGRASETQRGGGPVAADRILQYMSPIFKQWAVRDATFRSPIVPGMIRKTAAELRRNRFLNDDEIRTIWQALDDLPVAVEQNQFNGGYSDGARIQADILRMMFLTGCRIGEVIGMRRSELKSVHSGDFIGLLWTIPGDRYKNGKPHEIPLSLAATEIVQRQLMINDSELVFTITGGLFQGTSKLKARIDILCERYGARIQNWRFHDIRHTVKTVLRREGISPFLSERVLGHTIRGIEGTYDHYNDRKEKAAALEVLFTAITKIIKNSGPTRVEQSA